MSTAHVFGAVLDGHEMVVFIWSTEHGFCAERGIPAAFHSIDAYGPGRHQYLCAVCAANEADRGATIRRIDREETP